MATFRSARHDMVNGLILGTGGDALFQIRALLQRRMEGS
jgi:hypothetical protein